VEARRGARQAHPRLLRFLLVLLLLLLVLLHLLLALLSNCCCSGTDVELLLLKFPIHPACRIVVGRGRR